MRKQKLPGIEAVYRRRYRGEDAPADTVTCPGCALVFTPEKKSEEAAPAEQARARRFPATEALRAVASPDSDSLNEFQRRKREASDKSRAEQQQRLADDDRRAQEHRDSARKERGSRRPAKSLAQIASNYYGNAPDGAGEPLIPTSPRGGK